MPGDEHYGHGHAPKADQPANATGIQQGAPAEIAAPQFGGLDKYGRQPGDEHYGHDHE